MHFDEGLSARSRFRDSTKLVTKGIRGKTAKEKLSEEGLVKFSARVAIQVHICNCSPKLVAGRLFFVHLQNWLSSIRSQSYQVFRCGRAHLASGLCYIRFLLYAYFFLLLLWALNIKRWFFTLENFILVFYLFLSIVQIEKNILIIAHNFYVQ